LSSKTIFLAQVAIRLAVAVAMSIMPVGARGQQMSAGCDELSRNAATMGHAIVFLSINKKIYTLGESLVIDTGIRNLGPEAIYVFNELAWGPGGGVVIRLKNGSGREIAPVLRDDTLLPPPLADPHTHSLLLSLDEGEFFGAHRVLPISDLVKEPGKYLLQIEYRSPLFCADVKPEFQELPVIWHENGSLFSNVVSFTVKKPLKTTKRDGGN
jgi:hypothetical protein